MNKCILLAGLYHETNTFLNSLTELADFDVKHGEELWEAEGGASPLSGALEVARELSWDLLPVIDMRATPGATVSDEVVETFWTSLRAAVERDDHEVVDGIYLVLHGAMVSESLGDVEGELMSRIQSLDPLAEKPLCGVIDLHANFTAAMAQHSDGLIAYRKNPHTDARETAVDAARLLDSLIENGERAATLWSQPRVMWPPSGTATAEAPMFILEEKVRSLEAEHPDLLAVNVLAGFPFADVQEAGVSFSAVTVRDSAQARQVLDEMCDLAVSLQGEGIKAGLSLEEAMLKVQEHEDGPVLLVEPSDNIGAGAPGENTHLLRAFVDGNVSGAVAINDPQAVQQLQDLSPGHTSRIEIGGKTGEIGANSIILEVRIIRHTDGRFTLEDRRSHLASGHGEHIDMGPCVLVRYEGVLILLTSRRTPPFDLGQWRSVGVAPEDLSVIAVKAAAAHRQAYDPIAVASYTVDLPGPCAENLKRLPFERVRRPVYPLDHD